MPNRPVEQAADQQQQQANQPQEYYQIPEGWGQQQQYINRNNNRYQVLHDYAQAGILGVNEIRRGLYQDVAPAQPVRALTQDEMREQSRLKLNTNDMVCMNRPYFNRWDARQNLVQGERVKFYQYMISDAILYVTGHILGQEEDPNNLIYIPEEYFDRWFSIKRSLPSWF